MVKLGEGRNEVISHFSLWFRFKKGRSKDGRSGRKVGIKSQKPRQHERATQRSAARSVQVVRPRTRREAVWCAGSSPSLLIKSSLAILPWPCLDERGLGRYLGRQGRAW